MAQSSFDLDSADRPFDNIINFRDVGSSINALCGSRLLNEGVLFRSARLDDASERDKRRLTDELQISTVIDLRSSTEHQMATRKRRAEKNLDPLDLPDPDPSSPNDEHLVQFPGIRRSLISLTGKNFERALLWRLDWFSFLKVLSLSTWGYRSDAVYIVCSHIMNPRGLIGLGEDTLDCSFAEIKSVFEILAADDSYPVLVHCTQGKDRTGLVVLLLLLLTGVVGDELISGDYVKSEGELVPELEERLKEIHALGLDGEYVKCPPGFTIAIKALLDSKYGGVEGYLSALGIDSEKQDRIRRKLIA